MYLQGRVVHDVGFHDMHVIEIGNRSCEVRASFRVANNRKDHRVRAPGLERRL